ncbi:MAG: hypothetical protein ACJAQ3_001431 [Planctomycetota bacterium]|jgi:hypothetical protein
MSVQPHKTMDKNAISPKKPGRFVSYRWPMIVVGLLCGHVGAMALAVSIAGRDNGNSVLPDYYARALAWDDMRAKAADSALLGWDVFINTSPFAAEDGRRNLRIEILDKFKNPVTEASVSVRFWHRAEGKAIEAVLSQAGDTGVYEAAVPMASKGLWSCEIAAELGELLYVSDREIRVVNAAELMESGSRSSESQD